MAYEKNNNRGRRDDRSPEEKMFEEVVINIDRVARVVKGGRRFRFKALVVVGDKKTKVGVGVSKGADVQAAITKATEKAKKNLQVIPLYKSTIPHETEAKVGGANILLRPAAPGTGIIAGGTVRSILNVTGIHNVLSKSLGSSNKVNTAYATIEALTKLRPKDQWITTDTSQKKPVKSTSETAEIATEVIEAKKPAVKPTAKAKAKKTEKKS